MSFCFTITVAREISAIREQLGFFFILLLLARCSLSWKLHDVTADNSDVADNSYREREQQ